MRTASADGRSWNDEDLTSAVTVYANSRSRKSEWYMRHLATNPGGLRRSV